jgi:hypothetical protein
MRSPSRLCDWSPYQFLNQLIDFYEIRYEGRAIEGGLDDIIFNPIASTIQKWPAFRLLRWI